MKKKQNTRRSLTDSVQKIYDAGMLVTAGFILGFDSETGSVAQPMADFIEEAAIPVAMVGLLSALPNTQLTRRLISEHRLYEGHDFHPDGRGDQCVQGLNFETARPRREILEDYCRVLTRIYDPVVFCARVERLIGRLKWTGKPQQQYAPDDFRRRHGIEVVRRIVSHSSGVARLAVDNLHALLSGQSIRRPANQSRFSPSFSISGRTRARPSPRQKGRLRTSSLLPIRIDCGFRSP